MSFKHAIYSTMRKLVKNTNGKIEVNDRAKLGFWAPNGPTLLSKNNLVNKTSRKTLNKQVWDMRTMNGAWEDKNYENERSKLFMKYEEVKECTFKPTTYSEWPTEFKQLMDDVCVWYNHEYENNVRPMPKHDICHKGNKKDITEYFLILIINLLASI